VYYGLLHTVVMQTHRNYSISVQYGPCKVFTNSLKCSCNFVGLFLVIFLLSVGLVLLPLQQTCSQLNSTENCGRRCLTSLSLHHQYIINEQYHIMTSADRFPVPARSAVKSNFTNWCCQNLSKRALNALTVH